MIDRIGFSRNSLADSKRFNPPLAFVFWQFSSLLLASPLIDKLAWELQSISTHDLSFLLKVIVRYLLGNLSIPSNHPQTNLDKQESSSHLLTSNYTDLGLQLHWKKRHEQERRSISASPGGGRQDPPPPMSTVSTRGKTQLPCPATLISSHVYQATYHLPMVPNGSCREGKSTI